MEFPGEFPFKELDCFIYKGEMAKLNEDINDIIIQFLGKQDRYEYLECYYERLLEETGDYKEYRKNMRKIITEYWNDRDFWKFKYYMEMGEDWSEDLDERIKLDMKRVINQQCQLIYKQERIKCDICGCQLQRGSLSRHKKTKKCKANNPNN